MISKISFFHLKKKIKGAILINSIQCVMEDFMKKLVTKIIDKIRTKNYREYIKTNVLFLTTVVSLLFNATLLRIFTVKNYFEIKPLLADLAIVLILASFGYLFKPRKQFIYFFILSCFLTAVCIINSVYYTFYSSFASFSLLATSLQVVNVGDAVVKNVLQLKDFTYLFQPVLLLFVHFSLSKKSYYSMVEKIERGKKRLFTTLVTAFVIIGVFIVSLSALEIGRLVKQWNREFLVMKFGVYTYQFNDLFRSLEPRLTSAFGYDKAAKQIKEYYANKDTTSKTNKYTNIYKGKNIIVIHAESIQQFLLNQSFNGQPVTPNLDKLSKQGLYFSNYYSQVGVGTSSDTEFTFNTSLLPANSGTVFISYWDREFVTTPKLLKEQGYYSFSMHGNNGTFWNRLEMHKQMGYDMFYHKAYYKIDDVVGLGLSDKSFFRQSIPMIQNIASKHDKFYCTMIMLSNHTPFDDVTKYGDFPVDMKITKTNEQGKKETVSTPYMEGTELGNYFKSAHYADAAIGEFIDGLDKAGLLDNTVVVIYGDHDARLPQKDYERLYNYDPYTNTVLDKKNPSYKPIDYYAYELNRKVPFIIWTKDNQQKKEIKKPMGMYDAMPTLGNMFGFKSDYQLGHDIFSIDDNIVIFPNGNWLTSKLYYNSQKQEYKLLDNSGTVSQDYIDKDTKYTEETLDVSNDIIIYDYIRKSQEAAQVLKQSKE